MGLMEEVKADVIQRNTGGVQPVEPKKEAAPEPKKTRRRKNPEDMTKEEREAWLAKKREEEEAKYLGKSAKPAKKRRRKTDDSSRSEQRTPEVLPATQPTKPAKVVRQSKTDDHRAKRPKMLQPLETLYLLRIPGLPKGDCIAICYARGVDQ